MQKLGTAIIMILLVVVSHLVNAWGLMVFWNELVLNIWHLFTTADVINTMQISYGVFLAISFGLGLLWKPKADATTDDPEEAKSMCMTRMGSKIILICMTLLVISIVF